MGLFDILRERKEAKRRAEEARLEEERKREEELRRQREEEEKKRIEEIKADVHEMAKSHIYVAGDKRTCNAGLLRFIHPSYIDWTCARVLKEMADAKDGQPIDHEAQWVWSTKYLLGFGDDPDDCELAAHRAFNAARAGVVPAIVYCLDDYKSRGLLQQAVECLEILEEKEKDTACVITLEWKYEGFYFEKDKDALYELLEYAKVGKIGEAHSRARWYLDLKGIKWKD